MSDAIVWICGQQHEEGQWEFQGVFTTEDLAIAACRNETYFIGPAKLDEQLPAETCMWAGGYYPKAC